MILLAGQNPRLSGCAAILATSDGRVRDLHLNVVSLHQMIGILPADVLLCMFTPTAKAPRPSGRARSPTFSPRKGWSDEQHVSPTAPPPGGRGRRHGGSFFPP